MNKLKVICNICFALCFYGLLQAQVQQINYEDPEIVGRLKYDPINETSGMGMSYITDNAIWVHNDSGDGPNIYLIDTDGNLLNKGRVSGARANDWEDLSTFELNGKSYIIIGEFGDNGRNRSDYKLYIIEEPEYDPDQKEGHVYSILRTITYQYDNGKQNCESVGVDVATGKIILFSKSHDNEIRYVYELPLSVEPGSENLTAKRIASLSTDDTTAMDISMDGHRAIVLTYKDFAYEFIREDNETWEEAFNKGPVFDASNGYRRPYRQITMPIGRAGEESICYAKNSRDLYTMREGKGAEIYFLKGNYAEDPNSPNKAVFVEQNNVPKTLSPGQKAIVSVTLKNTGTSTWTKAGLYKLGSVDDNVELGNVRIELDEGESVQPNEQKTFTFEITGPVTPKAYNFQWRMVQENVEWFGEMSPKQKVVVLASNTYLDDCDSKTDWSPVSIQLKTDDIAQGTAALEYAGANEQEFYKVFSTPYDAKGTSSGTVLQFWYYVEDPSKFENANQVEISSSGGPDVDEYNWSISNLKSGWNFIQLPVSSATKRGNPDLGAINWFRLYRFKNASTTTRIDGIQLLGENILSLDKMKQESFFKLYPNPAKSEVFLSAPMASSKISVVLYNALGQVKSNRFNQEDGNHKIRIPLNDLKTGVYFLRITTDSAVTTKKILIE